MRELPLAVVGWMLTRILSVYARVRYGYKSED